MTILIILGTLVIFSCTAWLLPRILRHIGLYDLIWNTLIEGILLGTLMILCLRTQKDLFPNLEINFRYLIFSAILGCSIVIISSSVYWYFHDLTGKTKYTLRNLYTLIAGYRLILYNLGIIIAAFMHLNKI